MLALQAIEKDLKMSVRKAALTYKVP
ncbi:hypothetical protein CSPAE12_03618 [Colletotrichum incanum]|nr:hypothetical protein CSPAE12_03618 [Colletotrichum incanum]